VVQWGLFARRRQRTVLVLYLLQRARSQLSLSPVVVGTACGHRILIAQRKELVQHALAGLFVVVEERWNCLRHWRQIIVLEPIEPSSGRWARLHVRGRIVDEEALLQQFLLISRPLARFHLCQLLLDVACRSKHLPLHVIRRPAVHLLLGRSSEVLHLQRTDRHSGRLISSVLLRIGHGVNLHHDVAVLRLQRVLLIRVRALHVVETHHRLLDPAGSRSIR
uniref:Uncharacterized protein n=1 Tax=Anopheles dirus TaxID=7168 RepID=A0A182NVW6_9DIPT